MREWICGRNPVYEVLRARRRSVFRLLIAEGAQEKGRLAEIPQLAAERGVTAERAPRFRLDQINPGHQGIALEASGYPYSTLPDILQRLGESHEPPFILLLDTLQDPQNLGTLLRTAEAAGMHGVLLPYRHAATVTPAVVHASSGASEHLLVAQANLAQAIQAIKDEGVWVVGLEGSPEASPPDRVRLDGPIALVVGSEGQGMRALVRRSCDQLMRLPMRGAVASLNAAVAGSIAIYLVRQKRGFLPAS